MKQTMRGGSVLSTSTWLVTIPANQGLNGIMPCVGAMEYLISWQPSYQVLAEEGEKAMSNSNIKSVSLQKARIPVNSNTVVPGYWGELRSPEGLFIGILLVLLFLMGIQLVEGKMRWWFVVVSYYVIKLDVDGQHFEMLNEILFNYLPFWTSSGHPVLF